MLKFSFFVAQKLETDVAWFKTQPWKKNNQIDITQQKTFVI